MTDYTELVKALRCGEYKPECGSSDCPYWSGLGCMDGQLMEDAAASIEELWADNDILHQHIEDMNEAFREKSVECQKAAKRNAELHAELEKWVSAAEKAGEPKRGEVVRCGECKYHLPETERTNPYCNRFHCMKPDDWFCADGERSET